MLKANLRTAVIQHDLLGLGGTKYRRNGSAGR
jgi:hypothetical protein